MNIREFLTNCLSFHEDIREDRKAANDAKLLGFSWDIYKDTFAMGIKIAVLSDDKMTPLTIFDHLGPQETTDRFTLSGRIKDIFETNIIRTPIGSFCHFR